MARGVQYSVDSCLSIPLLFEAVVDGPGHMEEIIHPES